MPSTADEISKNVSAQIRADAIQRREPSPASPSPPQYPQMQVAAQGLAIELPEFAPQSSAIDLGRQVTAHIRDRAVRDRQSRSPSPSTQHALIIGGPAPTDHVVTRTFSKGSDSTEGDGIPVDENVNWFGALLYAVLAAVFVAFALLFEGRGVKMMCILLTTLSGFISIRIIHELSLPEPEEMYSPARILLRDLKKAVVEGEKRKEEFTADMDKIIKLDKRVRRMARAGVILWGGPEWLRWEEVRNRIFGLERPLPRVNWQSEPSPSMSQN